MTQQGKANRARAVIVEDEWIVARDLQHILEEIGLQILRLVRRPSEVPALLEQVSTAARQTGLDISSVTPLGVVPGDVFDTYRYRVSVTGSYHRISQFLNNVGSLTRIVAPMNLQLNPTTRSSVTRRSTEAALDASFEIQTYVAKTAVPPVAAGNN